MEDDHFGFFQIKLLTNKKMACIFCFLNEIGKLRKAPMNTLINKILFALNIIPALVIFSIERFFSFFRSVHPV